MKVKVSLASNDNKWRDAREPSPDPAQPVWLDPVFVFSDLYVNKSVQEISLRPGMKLIIADFTPQQTMTIDFEVEKAPLEFSFCVSGETRGFFADTTQGRSDEFYSNTGSCKISWFPQSKGTMTYQAQKRVCSLSIQIDPRFIQTFFESDSREIDTCLQFMRQASLNNHYFRHASMTPSMKTAVCQILNCPYQGVTRRIYMESKALELIALQIVELDLFQTIRVTTPSMKPSDRERIHQAREILISSLTTTPPSLIELSRTVGLTHTKLNQGFKEIFGTTVFSYLRQQRLEYGRLLLEEGQLNISETAYAAGFSSPSHFARFFLDHFGIQPNTFLKERQSKVRLQQI